MGKRDRQSRFYRPQPPFKIIEGVDTEPFMRLSPQAVWILTRFYCKWDGQIRKRTDLSVTYGEVKDTMSTIIFIRAIWECIGFGFIDVFREGRLERNASIYGLSNRWRALNDRQKCDEIEVHLGQIRELQRDRTVKCKRPQLAALRGQLIGRTNGISG